LAEYAADTVLAPETVGAQAKFALTNGDSFLRRMQQALLGTGGSVRGQQPTPSGSKSLSEIAPDRGSVFVNVRGVDLDGSPTTNAFGFDSQVTQVSGGVVVRPWDSVIWDNVTLGVIGGIDNGTADLEQYRSSIDLTSYHLGLMAGYDDGYSLEPTLTEILSAHSALPAIGSTWGLSPPARCSLCATPTSNLTNTKKQEPPAST
jgi:outer membrane autotransporter protein